MAPCLNQQQTARGVRFLKLMTITRITPAALPVSQIGLGCVTFGREIDEASSFALLDHALEHGVCHLDTAAAYGAGASEQILGRWLATRRPAERGVRISIATKVLPPYDDGALERSVEASLRRLGLEQVDLLYLHRWDESALRESAVSAMERLLQCGKVRALGVSNVGSAQLQALPPLFHAVQNNHNLAVSDVTPELRAVCAERGMSIITYSPLGAGFLTGKHRRGEGVPAGTRFDVIPGHQDVYFHEAAWRRLAHLEAVAARTGHAQAQLALAWALHQPGIASVLIGGRSPAHLDQALKALAFEEVAVLGALECA
ncbi:aldo/keto reductase [Brevifollis gellanilyticus]|uniref:Aldo/keto reductase n=1 Tax=Brevifollis gellanilyticus TaxID=748831 RepID=A0A512MIQ1_9BACT|nr:aldo/keto reductase [Brevifollis gellanilyticus]GEP46181.1 aldo/keto reductase [Brevifollis gellanilyticus]